MNFEMDSNIIQMFVEAAARFRNHPTEPNLEQLQRHLDILLGFTTPQVDVSLFDRNGFALSELFAAVTDFLTANEPKLVLVQKILSLLQNLLNCQCLKEALSSVFHLYSPLIILLQNIGINERQGALVAQSLHILERTTENVKLPYIDSQLESLLHILVLNLSTSTKLLVPCLGILSNLCRTNEPVQMYLKNLPNNKELMKILAVNVSDKDLKVSLPSLSLLSLVRKGEWGEKLFKLPNIFRTFELIIHAILGNDTRNKLFAINLLKDLIHIPSVRTELLSQKGILRCLTTVLKELTEKKTGSSYMLQFILIFMEPSNMRSCICSILREDNYLFKEILSALSYWFSLKVDHLEGETSDLAVQLLKLFLQEMVPEECIPDQYLDSVLKLAAAELQSNLDFSSVIYTGRRLRKLKSIADLLMVLSEKESLRTKVVQYVTADICYLTLSSLMENYHPNQNDTDTCEIDVMLVILSVIGHLEKHDINMKEALSKFIQCNKFIPFLAEGFTSQVPLRVQRSLCAIRFTGQITNFPHNLLGQAVAELNTPRNVSSGVSSAMCPAILIDKHKSIDSDIDSIILKVKQGLDVKDLKTSKIMDVYEGKVLYLQERERLLQELLDAKTAVLQKSDELLTQAKCKQSLRESESQKLRQLLQQSEADKEIAREKANQAVKIQKQCEKELQVLKDNNSQLNTQHEELRELAAEQEHTNLKLNETLKNLQSENVMLLDSNKLLEKHNESLKQKQEIISQDNANLKIENKQFVKQLNDKETKLNDATQKLQKMTADAAKLQEENSSLKTAEHNLRDVNSLLTREKAKLEQEASSYSALCRQHETTLKEKDQAIRNLQEQVQKLHDFNRLIHELSTKATLSDKD